MNQLICPVSSERVDRTVVRLVALLVASLVVVYAWTGSVVFLALLLADFFVRGWTSLPYSPAAWAARRIRSGLDLDGEPIDKAPKIFAARVGFLFTLVALALHPVSGTASLAVALTLMVFALLEALADFCVGCVVYNYLVLPVFGPERSG